MLFSGLLFSAALVVPVWAAFRLAQALSPAAPLARRLVETLVGTLFLIQLAVQAAGLTGCLDRNGLIIGLGVMALVGAAAARKRQPSSVEQLGKPPLAADYWGGIERWLIRITVFLFAVPLFDWSRIALTAAPFITGDDSNYHLTMVLIWLREGRFTLSGLDFGSTFPLGAELLPLWLMLPFADRSTADMLTWTSISALPWIGLLVASIALIVHSLGGRTLGWLIPSLILVSSVAVRMNATSFASVDNALPAAILAAVALFMSLYTDRVTLSREWYARCLLIACALGLGIGIKFTAIPLSAVLGVAILGLAWRTGKSQRVLATFALVAGVAFAAGGYWYVRNAIAFNNPFYPARFLGLPHDSFIYFKSTINEYIQQNGWSNSIRDILLVYLDWPRALGILAVAGLLFGPLFVCLANREQRLRAGVLALLNWGMISATLLLLPGQPWSAGCDSSLSAIHPTSQRYIELTAVLGWMWVGLSLGCVRGYVTARLVVTSLTLMVVITSFLSHGSVLRFIWVSSVAAGVAVAVAKRAYLLRPTAAFQAWWKRAIPIPVTAVIIVFTLYVGGHSWKRSVVVRSTIERTCGTDITQEVRLLDELPRGRVACSWGRHIVLLSKQKHDPVFVGIATPLPVRLGQPLDVRTFRVFGEQSPYDFRVHLAQADIVFAYVFGGDLTSDPNSLYNAASADPAFELRRSSRYAAVFVRRTDSSVDPSPEVAFKR